MATNPVCNSYPSEKLLFEGLKKEENGAFKCLYANCFQEFLEHIRYHYSSTLGEEVDEFAKNAFQDGLISLFINIREGKYIQVPTKKIKSTVFDYGRWALSTILKNSNVKKKTILSENHDKPDDSMNIEKNIFKEEDLERLNIAISMLNEPCKSLIKLKEIEKNSYDEISQIMGTHTSASLKNLLKPCFRNLRDNYRFQ